MLADPPEPMEPLWSEKMFLRLDAAVQARFEQQCARFEAELRSGVAMTELVERLRTEPNPTRDLIALNLAKCWGEDQLAFDSVWATGEAEFNQLFSDFSLAEEAQEEWRAWLANERTHAVSLDDSTPAFFEGAKAEPGIPLDELSALIPPSYKILKELSRTRMSQVYLVQNDPLDRQEVLKVVRISGLRADLVEQLEEEAARAAKISHPGLVHVFSAGGNDRWRYLLMEYMNGGSLAARLLNGPLPWPIAVRWFAIAARALDSLHHKAGLSHGDIKPENLMFTRQADDIETLKLGDFGLGSDLHHEEWDGSLVAGTPGYLAPELLSRPAAGSISFDVRVTADLFALGVSLYKSITGVMPYQEEGQRINPFGPLNNAYVGVEEIRSDIPPVVAYIVMQACARDLQTRFVSAGEMARALEKAVSLHSEQADLASIKSKSWPKSKEKTARPVPAWAVGVGAVVALGGFLFLNQTKDEAPVGRVREITTFEPSRRLPLVQTQKTPKAKSPEDEPSSDLRMLQAGRWSRPSAEAVLDLNKDWFQALRSNSSSVGLAGHQIGLLAELGDAPATVMEQIGRTPHFAAILALVGPRESAALSRALADGERQREFSFSNLLVQYPDRESVARCTDLWGTKRNAIRSLEDFGLFGAELIYITADDNDKPFVDWAEGVLVNRIQRGTVESTNMLAVFLEQQDVIGRRMRSDPGFAAQFQHKLWQDFLDLNREADAESGHGLQRILLDERVWDVLQLNEGPTILRQGRELALDLFSGPHALPQNDKLRLTVTNLLRTNTRSILETLNRVEIRNDPQFHHLLERGLPDKVVAVLCHRLLSGKPRELLAEYNDMTNDHLEAEVTYVDKERWGAERLVPQLIYIRLGAKVLTGGRLYGVQKNALMFRAATDVVTVVLPQAGLVGPATAEAINQGADLANEVREVVIKEMVKAEQFQALAQTPGQASPADVVPAQARQFRELLESIRQAIGASRDGDILDVTTARLFFERLVQTRGSDREFRRVDFRKIRLYRMKDGRVFAVPSGQSGVTVLETEQVRNFFRDRLARLTRLGIDRQADHDADLAYRQILSAWWLLAASGRIPTSL